MVKGLKDIHSWPLFDWSLPIYINKVKPIHFLVFGEPNEVRPSPSPFHKTEHNSS